MATRLERPGRIDRIHDFLRRGACNGDRLADAGIRAGDPGFTLWGRPFLATSRHRRFTAQGNRDQSLISEPIMPGSLALPGLRLPTEILE
jgi:hypothetical protein